MELVLGTRLRGLEFMFRRGTLEQATHWADMQNSSKRKYMQGRMR